MTKLLIIAKGLEDLEILPRMANRHGLIPGATDTGKSVVRAAGSQIGRSLIRGAMGSLFGGGGKQSSGKGLLTRRIVCFSPLPHIRTTSQPEPLATIA